MRLLLATLVALLALASPAVASQVSNVTVDHTDPSPAAGARTVYRVSFTTSPTGGLTGNQTLQVTLPDGTGMTDALGGTLRDITRDVEVGYCWSPSPERVVTCTLYGNLSVPAGNRLTATVRGVTNASAGGRVTVSTAADQDPAQSPLLTIEPGGQVRKPTLTVDSPSAAAGARTRYVITFSVSASGGLSAEAGSDIFVILPDDITTPAWQGGVVYDVTRANTDVGYCDEPAGGVSRCHMYSNSFVKADDELRIILRGITNGAAGAKTVSVRTTSDLPPVASDPVQVVAPRRSPSRRSRSTRPPRPPAPAPAT